MDVAQYHQTFNDPELAREFYNAVEAFSTQAHPDAIERKHEIDSRDLDHPLPQDHTEYAVSERDKVFGYGTFQQDLGYPEFDHDTLSWVTTVARHADGPDYRSTLAALTILNDSVEVDIIGSERPTFSELDVFLRTWADGKDAMPNDGQSASFEQTISNDNLSPDTVLALARTALASFKMLPGSNK